MNQSKPTSEVAAPKRRRLLRGALAAPVVLTVSNGAGATMNSNMRCVANQVVDGSVRTYPAGTGVPSTVIRVQLYRNTANDKRFISGTELQGLAHQSRPVSWISNGQWQEFSTTNNMLVGTPHVPGTTPTITNPVEYANVQMDQHGYILAVGKNNSSSTSMMAATCWNSFRAGPVI